MVPGTSKDGSASKGLDLPRSLNTEKGSEDDDDLESVASGNSGSTHKSVKRQRSMDAFAVRTSADQKARIDMQVARFFFGSNLPFRVVENNEFSKLVELLRPGYQPPNRKALAGDLLDTVHEVIQSMKAEITDDRSTLTIMQDGWSNVKKYAIIAHCVHNGTKAYLLNITDPGSTKKTAEYCAELTEKAITEVSDHFDKEVSCPSPSLSVTIVIHIINFVLPNRQDKIV